MHYHLEIIMPPTEDVHEAVSKILEPFSEYNESEEDQGKEKFWDFWSIGGRFSGSKFEAKFRPEDVQAFRDWMTSERITVSSLTMGKETLYPPEQKTKVDAKWNEMFPSGSFVPCPLFDHSTHENTPDDIMRLGAMPHSLTAARVIIASPSFKFKEGTEEGAFDGPLEAGKMISDSMWNGASWVDSKWDGLVKTVIDEYRKSHEKASEDWKKARLPTDDWLVVTVDYHS